MMAQAELESILSGYLPPEAVSSCAALLLKHHVHLKITASRRSKYGDYRAPYRGGRHRISINHNLNPYMFLVTFVHEMAHLETYNRFQHRVDAHGSEWKGLFRELMTPFLAGTVFPEKVKEALQVHLDDPSASSCGDHTLYKALKIHDEPDSFIFLEYLPEGCYFRLKGYSNVLIKGKRLRKTFHCKMQNSKREFRVSAVAEVQQVGMF